MARKTLIGAGTGGALFLALGAYLNLSIGAGPLANLGPLAMLTVIGATIGGLIGPLIGSRR